MLCCLDVDYREQKAVAAAVLFEEWSDQQAVLSKAVDVAPVEPYQPGSFYLRELPCLLAVLRECPEPIDCLIVDGYVWLAEGKPGLGAHLWEQLGRNCAVVGVAKNCWKSDGPASKSALPVLRGQSQKPLWVTAAGMDLESAAENVRKMDGGYRIPTLLKAVDSLCRSHS